MELINFNIPLIRKGGQIYKLTPAGHIATQLYLFA